MKELYYKVAEHVFVLKTGEHDSLLGELRQYEPFIIEPTTEVTFSVEIVDDLTRRKVIIPAFMAQLGKSQDLLQQEKVK